ncbi:MAG: ZIP family metal transporter [Flavobacteriaceae bacterium]|nr:ZIP family metal transporter [Flavobacteriaceae bacterium]
MSNLILFLSVVVGILIVLLVKPKLKTSQILLSFSGAYLLAIIILELIPEVFQNDNNINVGVFIIIGLIVQLVLDFFSKGADHGHVHLPRDSFFPWVLLISLSLHAFIEGLPLSHLHNHSLLIGIVVHNVPISIILGTAFVTSKIPKKNALFFLIVFAMMSPLGNLTGSYFPFIQNYKTAITALVIGVLLHISTTIIFESSKDHKFNLVKFISILIGFILAIIFSH